MDNNPNCPQLDDHDYKGVPQNDIMRLVSSQFIPPIQGPDLGLSIHLLYSLGRCLDILSN